MPQQSETQKDVDYQKLSRDLYITMLQLLNITKMNELSSTERLDCVWRVLRDRSETLADARGCFDLVEISKESVVHSRTNPKIPEGYTQVSNRGKGDGYANNGFHENALCSDDGVTWCHVSRIGEPGTLTIVVEPTEQR